MGAGLLGRTNQAFPPVWLSLAAPADSSDLAPMVEAALSAQTVIDVSAHPGLFGGFMRGTGNLIMTCGGSDIVNTADEDSSANNIHAHLIETLSAIGREWIDFYFLRVRRPLEEYQINGALRALEWAREEGHVKHVGICAEADPIVVVGTWQFHDAFEVLLLSAEHAKHGRLTGLAAERRVGIVTRGETGETSLVTVRSVLEIKAATEPVLVT